MIGDRNELARLFRDAGLASFSVSTHHGTASFPSIKALVEADLRRWLPVMVVMLAEEQIESILNEAERVLNPYVTTSGTIEFDAPAHIAIAGK